MGQDQRVCEQASNDLSDLVSSVVTNSALTDLIALFVLFSVCCSVSGITENACSWPKKPN